MKTRIACMIIMMLVLVALLVSVGHLAAGNANTVYPGTLNESPLPTPSVYIYLPLISSDDCVRICQGRDCWCVTEDKQ